MRRDMARVALREMLVGADDSVRPGPITQHLVGQGPRALPWVREKLGSGRCGERTERCQWQRKRSERVAAVKILSVRRKAAQKFWAPQQDHRPLRRGLQGAQRAGCSGDRPYEILRFGIFPGENFLRQGDSVISRLFSSGLPSTMGETKEGIA